ncbi:hypothetical protein [Novilysobacter selenitireducens]|uniref:Uncharacterized protein n=1 Tax=Novilysobacter selenitireducens TaxID=2872639 RepID=A0ABS7T441_9GAMM|nr:hypothetical protein [Lysobacter selenitireducens]MBZ4038644.1 hypothetical protein [Lysobacter selenitireducens]
MKHLLLLALLAGVASCATDPSPQQQAADRAVDAVVEQNARKLDRAIQQNKEASARGPFVRQGFLQLREGMTEEEVDAIFHGIAYTPSQEICGQSSTGPISCKVRTYYGLIDGTKIDARIVFSRSASGGWAVVAWQ